jgi:hypothetical protein
MTAATRPSSSARAAGKQHLRDRVRDLELELAHTRNELHTTTAARDRLLAALYSTPPPPPPEFGPGRPEDIAALVEAICPPLPGRPPGRRS